MVPLLPPAGTQWESRRHGALGGRGKSAARKEGGRATSGEVHDLEGLGVDGDCSGKCHNRPVVPVARLVAAFTAVVLFLDEVISSAEGHQVRIVGRSGDGDGASAAHIRVAQLVGQALQFIRRELVVVPEHVVV